MRLMEDVLKALKPLKYRRWNRSGSSDMLSESAFDACNRIYDDFADVIFSYDNEKRDYSIPVWTMGSCFARELEYSLRKSGANVVSVTDQDSDDLLRDETGKISTSLFHRYTPAAMAQDIRRSFDEQPNWTDESLLFDSPKGIFDAHYNQTFIRQTLDEALRRRQLAKNLVRNVKRANVIALTLGLVESWRHLPTGLVLNSIEGSLLTRKGEFSLEIQTASQVVEDLESIYDLISRHHESGDFDLFITVSPVPMQSTFTSDDVIIANTHSKSTLRVAAADFVSRHNNTHYFPSYEIVTFSNQAKAWRPDRIHVQPEMVAQIMANFRGSVFE